MKTDLERTVEKAARLLLDAARYLDGAGCLCEDEGEDGSYYLTCAAQLRVVADELMPPLEDWPDNVVRFPHERVRSA